jgi:hypothetical protein
MAPGDKLIMTVHLIHNPHIRSAIELCEIKENSKFSINISEAFSPQDGSLKFSLVATKPEWLHIEKMTGILYGEAPSVTYDKVYKTTVMASNHFGYAAQSVVLKILSSNVVESMLPTLTLALNLRQERYGFSHIHPYTPSLLEYIYTIYQMPQYKKLFFESMQKQAKKINIQLTHHPSFEEFHHIVTQLNPQIENYLTQRLTDNVILFRETVSFEELQNLYRLGFKIEEITPMPLWEYLNVIEQNNKEWQIIDNIFSITAQALLNLRQEEQVSRYIPRLQLKPKDIQ